MSDHITIARNINRGDTRTITATFRNAAGTLTDPTTVTFTVRTPTGTETAYVYGTDAEVVKGSTGVYSMVVALTAGNNSNPWQVRIVGTGTVAEAHIVNLHVSQDDFS